MIPLAARPAPESPPPRPRRESLACLVVEDHTLIGQLLAGILRSLPGIGSVVTATKCAEATAAAAEHDIDLLLLDLKLPDGDGLGVLEAAAKRHPALHCIVLSSAADEFACPAELKNHLAALLDKTAPLDTLRLEVEAVVRRRLGDRPENAQRDLATVLRPRELEILVLIGKGKTTREIAGALGITVNTVNTHRKSIVARLGVVGAELVRLATLYNEAGPDKAGMASPDSRRGKGRQNRLPG